MSLSEQFPPACRSANRYKRLNHISQGTFGVVYRAEDLSTGEIVALKKFKLDANAVNRYGFPVTALREIALLVKLSHPNILDCREVVTDDEDQIYVVMEYVDHDLKDVLTEMKHTFVASEVKCLMHQLLTAVAYLHDNWVVHRDLKTSNLLYSNRGGLKVADFGSSRHYADPLETMTPGHCTLWYRAPELLLGAPSYGTPMDIWSIGCIFAEFLCKQPLLPGTSEINQLDLIFALLGTPRDEDWPGWRKMRGTEVISFTPQTGNLRQRLPFLTPCERDLLERMFTFNPDRRITAAEALQHAYFTEEHPPPKTMDMMPTFPSRHEKRQSESDVRQALNATRVANAFNLKF